MSVTVYEDKYFVVGSPDHPLNDREDGGHLIRGKKERVFDRSDLTVEEAIDFMRISMMVGRAMYDVLGIERMNYEDLANWGLDDPEGPKMHLHFFGAMVALIAIIGFTAYASTRYMHDQNIKGIPEAIIAKNGIYLNRRLYYWNYFGTSLDKVSSDDEKGMTMIHFVTWAPTMTLGQTWDIRVPVPPGEEAKAAEIVAQLKPK
jgi:hypothetical protein